MRGIRINEAFEFARQTQPKLTKTELAKRVWETSTDHAALTNLSNLNSGRSKTFTIRTIQVLCRELGVTSDFLFGISDVPSNNVKKQELNEYACLMQDTISDLKDAIENF